MDEYGTTAEFYDHIGAYRDRQDVDFYIEMAKAAHGPVLEIGCGMGRVLLPLARAGVEILGMDLSPSMLSLCRERLTREPNEAPRRVQLHEGDMRQFEFSRRFQSSAELIFLARKA